MARTFRGVFVVLFGGVALWHAAGCQSPQETRDLFAALQQGKARGHLVLTTSGLVTAGTQTEFFLGLRDTSLSFDGNIDFAEAEFERQENVEASKRQSVKAPEASGGG